MIHSERKWGIECIKTGELVVLNAHFKYYRTRSNARFFKKINRLGKGYKVVPLIIEIRKDGK
jgi:hypothetical protein